ncbi:MAG: hypothetical protein J0L75_12295 [Spirochaetes bacterium]|nr:hypothetical protein [Spirochaetota bacterium]
MNHKALAATALFLACQASAFELVRETQMPNLGIPAPYTAADNEWRSRMMACPEKVDASTRIWSGPDFFEGEYGKPCAFTEDWLAKEGYAVGPYAVEGGALAFTTGAKGFTFGFGPQPGKSDRPAIRFGFNWGPERKDLLGLRMEVEQSVEETDWEFSIADPQGKGIKDKPVPFKVKGTAAQVFETDITFVRVAMNGYGTAIQFACKTPGAAVKIRALKLAPSSAEVFFRRTVTLPEAPISAHCSFKDDEVYSLYVNGKLVGSGTRVYPCGILKSVDLAPYLKKGENLLAFSREFLMWNTGASKPELLFEGVAIGRSGSVTRLVGDGAWRSTVRRREGWMAAGFDDGDWAQPVLGTRTLESEGADGKPVFIGVNPKYMGMLDAAPEKRTFPIYQSGETPRFRVRLPLGVKGVLTPALTVCRGASDEALEAVGGAPQPDEGDFAVWRFEPKTREAGPYRLLWTLRGKDATAVETRREEFVIAGKVRQDVLPLDAFESNFEGRLKLVTKIDCTQSAPPEGEFLDHAGMYSAPGTNRGKVSTEGPLTYRETGKGRWDYFAYRLHLRERGVAYLAEVIVPDDQDRYIYSGITENYPIGFMNNVPSGSTGWFTATGTCYTGVRYPLSGGKKRLRYVFFPASFNASIVVMSGFGGIPAAACEINIYKIEGGLPALEIPPSGRLFGSHNERISTLRLTTGMSENPAGFDKGFSTAPHKDFYHDWYRALERKIALLRFQGYNMSTEGLYMYTEGDYPSAAHGPRGGDGSEVDAVPLLMGMYRENGIKLLFGFEYIASPQVYLQGKGGLSERRLWAGEKSTRLVDRYGRQLHGYMNNGFNFLNPDVASIMKGCVSEIYGRYQGYGDIAGFFLVHGQWWLPTFNTHAYRELGDLEVGYDDDTVGQFEKESRIALGISGKDPMRFQKRYEAIMAKFPTEWVAWRAQKMKAFTDEIAALLQTGASKWRLYQFPTGIDYKQDTPFLDPASTRADREGFMEKRFRDFGAPLSLYRSQRAQALVIPLGNWAKFGSPRENYDWVYGWNKNPGSRDQIEAFGALYVGVCSGLDEVDAPAAAAGRWLFRGTARGVFTPRAVEDCAMNEFVDGVSGGKVPTAVFDQWIDCNLETGFGPQFRRFAKSFYATPEARFQTLAAPAARGVMAQTARNPDGSICLRLINSTPYASMGSIGGIGTVRDLVYDKDLAPGKDGIVSIAMKPFDIRLFRIAGPEARPTCRLAFEPRVEASILADARLLMGRPEFLKKIPSDLLSNIEAGVAGGDAFAVWNTMEDFEVLAQVRSAKALVRCRENQASFLEDLKKSRTGRIHCGSRAVYTDLKGRRWLPDQEFQGEEAYGGSGGTAVDRGKLDIKDPVAPGIYCSEIYGNRIQYKIPLPPGRYRVRLHFCESYIKNSKPGMRLFNVLIAGRLVEERLDLVARAGAQYTPVIVEADEVPLSGAGLLEIELTGNACLNGIEVERSP